MDPADRGGKWRIEESKDLLVDKGWDPAMGARPLRRAIQRYIEDPLADEVLRQGEIVSGTTALVGRDADGDADEHPLKLKLVKPRKRPAKKKPEPVGVGAKKGDSDSGDAGPDEPGDADTNGEPSE